MGKPIIRIESGQTPYPFESLDTSDNKTFEASFAPWSDAAGFEPVVAPYGLLTGGDITPNSGTNDSVSVAALTASMAGATGADSDGQIAVSSGTVAITRASVDTHIVNSITVDNTGSLVAVQGSEGTSFSETRGAAGGPPLIPVDSIEIGQVRTSTSSAAEVASSEIYTTPGLHVERSDYPVYEIDYGRGEIVFAASLPLIHAGDVPKSVYAKGATPLFAPIAKAYDWTPAESTYSINSTDTYDGPVGAASSSLGQASFTAIVGDGITDPIVAAKGKTLWVEFRPDRDKLLPKQWTQGIIGVSRNFPAGGGSFNASVTVTPTVESMDVES